MDEFFFDNDDPPDDDQMFDPSGVVPSPVYPAGRVAVAQTTFVTAVAPAAQVLVTAQ